MSIPYLTQLAFSRYRCFRDPQKIELGRLNLAYGVNNVGKSALVRLPALIADSLTPGVAGINGSSAVLARSSARDLMWRGARRLDEDTTLTFGVRCADGVQWSWQVEWDDLERRLRVSATVQTSEGEARHFEDKDHRFDGLVPDSNEIPRAELLEMLNAVIWLAADRRGPSPLGGINDPEGRLWNDGRTAGRALLANRSQISNISRFYEQHTKRSLVIQGQGSEYEDLRLQTMGQAPFRVSFNESGSGLRHIFPILAALEVIRERGGLLIVEEPEAHLHPNLEQALAEHTVEVLSANPHAQVLYETHSEVFLLAALQAATRSDMGPKAVKLLWTESDEEGASLVKMIPVDADGRPDGLEFEHAFRVLGDMRRKLLRVRRYGR